MSVSAYPSPAAAGAPPVRATRCRFCSTPLEHMFCNLGMSPLANSYIPADGTDAMEPFYPLRALVCHRCFLVQLAEYEPPRHIFGEYAYFSSYSTTWLEHARVYADMAIDRFGLDRSSRVVELASNDGYLLQYFMERGVPVLGVEPAANVAAVALQRGIPTVVEFFGVRAASALAQEGRADLLVGNNVLAHVPDLNDFVAGMKILLAVGGVITMEFPHLQKLIDLGQWDTIYHEHFSYLSFSTAARVFTAHGLRLFDVEELPTHGGSLRIYACHDDDGSRPSTERPASLLERERSAGFDQISTYTGFDARAAEDKRQILSFLIELKAQGRRIAAYGAPAKGNTLLNYCGLRTDFIAYTCDLNPHKQGHVLPGTHIPIRSPEAIAEDRPDVVLILPWNLREEIIEQLRFIRDWGGQFAARAPEMRLFP